VKFDFDKFKIEITVKKEVDGQQTHFQRTHLIFEQVSSINTSEIGNLEELYSVEILEVEFEVLENTHTAKFIFLGQPGCCWVLSFSFQNLIVIEE
jgi:hypothetical protein